MHELPLHLAGNNGPVAHERDAVPARVVGEVPPDLYGTFLRNGPNPRAGWSPHLFAGDGMVHAIGIEGGSVRWYRNRYVRTPLYDDPRVARGDPRVTTANTHVISYAGRILALEEGGFPYELTAGLDTVGPFTFGGTLRTPMTAHPKVCPSTGDLLFFGYQVPRPHLVYYRATADGRLVESAAIDMPACSMLHDFAITERHVLFLDSCWVFDWSSLTTGSPWRWIGDRARIGVMERARACDVRWFDVADCHLSHAANAWDEGDAVVLTGTRIDGPLALPALYEWRIDVARNSVTERAMDDISVEYPRTTDDVVGRRTDAIFTSGFFYEAEPHHGEIHRYRRDGTRTTHRFPDGHTCGEAVPARNYLLTFAHDRAEGTSYLVILDAEDVGAEPIAKIHLPLRIPAGFHGSWVPRLDSSCP